MSCQSCCTVDPSNQKGNSVSIKTSGEPEHECMLCFHGSDLRTLHQCAGKYIKCGKILDKTVDPASDGTTDGVVLCRQDLGRHPSGFKF